VPKIRYQSFNFRETTLAMIKQANEIIEEYAAQGFDLTLRQLYYQFVSRGLLENKQEEYKRLGSVVNDGRMAGMIDWERITDRTRNLQSVSHWDRPQEILETCAEQFRIDKWARQKFRPEVWIEKEALAGVFEGVCRELDVSYFCCRGYTSQSEMWGAGMRLKGYAQAGQRPVILHFGDHDPSGIDMTRDIKERLRIFSGLPVKVDRLALNMDQVEEHNPPPNPAKMTDTRATVYVETYGESSWELDALDPTTLAGIVRQAVEGVQEPDQWQEDCEREEECRRLLGAVSDQWDGLTDGL
jgi:hypothetical protein